MSRVLNVGLNALRGPAILGENEISAAVNGVFGENNAYGNSIKTKLGGMTIDQVKTFLEEQEGKQKRKGMEEHGKAEKMKESAELGETIAAKATPTQKGEQPELEAKIKIQAIRQNDEGALTDAEKTSRLSLKS